MFDLNLNRIILLFCICNWSHQKQRSQKHTHHF